MQQHLRVTSAGYIAGAAFFSDMDQNGLYSRAMERAAASLPLGHIAISPAFGPPTLPFAAVQLDVGGTDSLTGASAPFIRLRAPAGTNTGTKSALL